MKKSTLTAKWAFGYCALLVCLFTICTVSLGLSTTVWGFAIGFAVCTIGVLVLWRREDHQQGNFPLPQEAESAASILASQAEASATLPAPASTTAAKIEHAA